MLQALQAVNWAVEGDHEMGLDEVPTRLNNPTDNSEPDSFNQPASNVHSNTNPVAPSGNKQNETTNFNKSIKRLVFKLKQKYFFNFNPLVKLIRKKCFLNCKCL